MKIIRILLFSFLLALQSCSIKTSGNWSNEDIDEDIKNIIHEKNDKLMKAMASNNTEGIRKLGSAEFLKASGKNLDSIFKVIHKVITKPKYKVLDEYYNNHAEAPNTDTLTSEAHHYTLVTDNTHEESYVSLLLSTNESGEEYMITAVYGLDGKEWKIDYIYFNIYSYHGKDYKAFYEMAKAAENKGFRIDALNYSSIAVNCLEPSGPKLTFDESDEIRSYNKLMLDFLLRQYKFPLPLKSISSAPEILGVSSQYDPEGFYPVVIYGSRISLGDSIALKKEYEQVRLLTPEIYKDLDFNKKKVYYKVYNALPDPEHITPFYVFIDEKKK
jgi:hypothetical protein